MMTDWYEALFSLLAGPLTQQQKDDLANLQCAWVLLNQRVGRWYVNILGPKTKLLAIEQYLTDAGRDPRRIAVFQYQSDGQTESMALVGPTNKAEYLNVAPDVVTYTYDANGNISSTQTSRPAAFIDVHRFAGWPGKNVP